MGIIAIKTVRTQIHFLSAVLVAVASLDLKVLIEKNTRRKYRELQAKLFELWDQYEAKERSAKSLLKACSHLNGPRES